MTPSQTAARWNSDPQLLARMNVLIRLTQRTEFVREILNLDDISNGLIAKQIQQTCELNGVVFLPPRGKASQGHRSKKLLNEERVALSLLLGLMPPINHVSIKLDDEGNLNGGEIVDNLISCYLRYMQIVGITEARTAPVTFEFFVRVWQNLRRGDATLDTCENCGSRYVMFLSKQPSRCPCCTHFNLPDNGMSRSSRGTRIVTSIIEPTGAKLHVHSHTMPATQHSAVLAYA